MYVFHYLVITQGTAVMPEANAAAEDSGLDAQLGDPPMPDSTSCLQAEPKGAAFVEAQKLKGQDKRQELVRSSFKSTSSSGTLMSSSEDVNRY